MSRPNILLAISDDQSWRHAGAYGMSAVFTPAFDRIADMGVLFTHGYCPAPQCSPSRACTLTGRNIWELEEAGTHASIFPAKFPVYPELLEATGYHVGYTGKPWAPGNWQAGGRTRNPAGPEFNMHHLKPPTTCISTCDYVGNFQQFLSERPKEAPFCFWFGCHEPHRNYERDCGVRAGKDPDRCSPPGFLPDHDVVRRDLLDYEFEVEWFDAQLDAMLAVLDQIGELGNTLVVVTSDNGMPFPKAKANLYEYGIHVPLAVAWPDAISGGRTVHDFTTLADLAPTFLEVARVPVPDTMSAKSLMGVLSGGRSGWVDPFRDCALTGKERHNHARRDDVGYPCRAIRTRDYLYVRNLKPERWPLGDPPTYYCHTQMTNPTKDLILQHQDEEMMRPFYENIYAKRVSEELYFVADDLDCMHNLADSPEHQQAKQELWKRLEQTLTAQGDPRFLGYGDIFDSYPHYGPKHASLGGFMEDGSYDDIFWAKAQNGTDRELQRNHI